jgi:hypothetical protein
MSLRTISARVQAVQEKCKTKQTVLFLRPCVYHILKEHKNYGVNILYDSMHALLLHWHQHGLILLIAPEVDRLNIGCIWKGLL